MARNRYPGICYRCKNTVRARDGHFESIKGVRGWLLQHAECAIKYRGTNVGKEELLEKLKKKEVPVGAVANNGVKPIH